MLPIMVIVASMVVLLLHSEWSWLVVYSGGAGLMFSWRLLRSWTWRWRWARAKMKLFCLMSLLLSFVAVA